MRRGGEVTNYANSDLVSNLTNKPYPRWYTRHDAQQIAEREGLPFEEL